MDRSLEQFSSFYASCVYFLIYLWTIKITKNTVIMCTLSTSTKTEKSLITLGKFYKACFFLMELYYDFIYL